MPGSEAIALVAAISRVRERFWSDLDGHRQGRLDLWTAGWQDQQKAGDVLEEFEGVHGIYISVAVDVSKGEDAGAADGGTAFGLVYVEANDVLEEFEGVDGIDVDVTIDVPGDGGR